MDRGDMTILWNKKDVNFLESFIVVGKPMFYWLRCVICDSSKGINLHHIDYEKDIVIPVCRSHHFWIHCGEYPQYLPVKSRRFLRASGFNFKPEINKKTGLSVGSRATIRRAREELIKKGILKTTTAY